MTALTGIVGVVMLIVSFSINAGPPSNATTAQLIAFADESHTSIALGAWLQTVGPLLIVLFAFAIVIQAGATAGLGGWMTMFGGAILMMVSLIEITFYFGAIGDPITTGLVSLSLIHAVQHLYFIVGAPALLLPLGAVIVGSRVLPRMIGYSAIALGVAFGILGVAFLYDSTLPMLVQAFAGVQVFWWLAAAIAFVVGAEKSGFTTLKKSTEGI